MKNIDLVTKRITEHNDTEWAMNINHFDWVPGVGLYGIYRAWQNTSNKDYFEFINLYIKNHISKAYELKTINSCAPLSTILLVYDETKNDELLKVCIDIANYLIDEAPRAKNKGFEHTVTEDSEAFKQQVWADTLFMVCIFLARLGKITENQKYTIEAYNQLYIHHKYLKDEKTSLFYHGYNCNTCDWMSGAKWGRANAWMAISTVEMLEILPTEFEGRTFILNSLNEQVKALSNFQRKNGMFGTLIDDADCYDETSATAGIAYAIKRGIKSKYISDEFIIIATRAEDAVIMEINNKGEVLGVSGGTPVMPSQDAYKTIEVLPTLYGQALTILMLCEG